MTLRLLTCAEEREIGGFRPREQPGRKAALTAACGPATLLLSFTLTQLNTCVTKSPHDSLS